MYEVYLGGTVGKYDWRTKLQDDISNKEKLTFYHPMRDVDTEYQNIEKRFLCDVILYVLTPEMQELISLAELVDESHKNSDKVVYYFVPSSKVFQYSSKELEDSLADIGALIESNGGVWCRDYSQLVEYFNSYAETRENLYEQEMLAYTE